MAGLSKVFPSPVAPKVRTLKSLLLDESAAFAENCGVEMEIKMATAAKNLCFIGWWFWFVK
jgi:hypothetical protein